MSGRRQHQPWWRIFLMAQQIHVGDTENSSNNSSDNTAAMVKSSPCTLWNVEEPQPSLSCIYQLMEPSSAAGKGVKLICAN